MSFVVPSSFLPDVLMSFHPSFVTTRCTPRKVASFAWDDVPWDELAFPTVTWCLEHARDHVGVARGGGGGGGGGGAPRPWSDDFDVLQRRKMVVDGVWTVTDES